MSHWRKERVMTMTIEGATTRVTMRPSEFGWEVRVWTQTVGAVRSYAEGEPIFKQTYGDKAEAIASFHERVALANDDPFVYVEPEPRMLQDIDPDSQRELDGAGYADQRSSV